jgi:hypothetical protein
VLDQQVYVAVDDGEVIAFGHYDHGEILAVYVDPRHVRRGVGRLMMAKLEEVARAEGATHLHLNAALNSAAFYDGDDVPHAWRAVHQMRADGEGSVVRTSFRRFLVEEPDDPIDRSLYLPRIAIARSVTHSDNDHRAAETSRTLARRDRLRPRCATTA